MVSSPTPDAPLLRGSLITLKRRCGKPNCHCADGDPHETPALSYSVRGKTRMLTLRRQDVALVREGVARYRKALENLEREALRGIEALRRRIEQEKARARRRAR